MAPLGLTGCCGEGDRYGDHDQRFRLSVAGEIGVTGVAAAVANAVFNATGKRVRELPITLDKLLM